MPALRQHVNVKASVPAEAPYPSWSSIADDIGCAPAPAQECRALKEARIWRALAEESVLEQDGPDVGQDRDGDPRP